MVVGLCMEVCPKKAITLVENEEGFLEFKIDKNKCIDCGICVKKCPQLNEYKKRDYIEQKFYAAHIKNQDEILKSTSGGIFPIIAKKVSEKDNYVIFGCEYDENFVARHNYIEDIKDLYKFRGSKYVQSDTRLIYNKVKEKLEDGKNVLFTGTPCQVSALYSYLNNKVYKNLYTIDLVCHGVPSPLLFKKYLQYLEKRNNGKIEEYEFRNKDKKNWELLCFYKINNKKIYKNDSIDPYYSNFIKGNTYRESCYECKYAQKERIGDITLADFWGIEKEHPEIYSKLGNSAVIVNTKKGEELFNLIKDNIDYVESNYNKVSKQNHNLKHPTNRPEIRNNIYKDIKDKDFEQIIKENLKFKITTTNFIKSLIPVNVKNKIKEVLKK